MMCDEDDERPGAGRLSEFVPVVPEDRSIAIDCNFSTGPRLHDSEGTRHGADTPMTIDHGGDGIRVAA
jgi:hypothetical protein